MNVSEETIEKLRKEFKEKGIVTIPNFLITELADQIYDFIDRTMPQHFWSLSTWPSEVREQGFVRIDGTIENVQRRALIWSISGQQINTPQYLGYRFYRTDKHVAHCDCHVCKLDDLLNSKEAYEMVEKLTGFKPITMYTSFISKYNEGCFLNVHDDKGHGQVAFVLNFTRDWHVMKGGCLTILDQDRKTVKETIVPEFNSMTLFHVPPEGINHCVTPVPLGVIGNRYAFSGWWRETEVEKK